MVPGFIQSGPLVSRAEILSQRGSVPAHAGLYAWFFKTLPPGVDPTGCFRRSGLTLLYIGISPSRSSSSSTLRTRVRYHLRGNAAGSTLRLTLGCLLEDQLGTVLRRVGRTERRTFTNPGERALDDWLDANAFVAWEACPEPWVVEAAILASGLPLPLNIDGNPCAAHVNHVSGARRAARARSDLLPVVLDGGGARTA
jgi:hypothetical protein